MVDKAMPGDIEDAGRIFPTKAIGESGEKEGLAAPTQNFAAFMKQGGSPMEAAGKQTMVSPYAMMHPPATPATNPSYQTLLHQVNSVNGTLGDISNQLNTPKLKLKASTKYLVKSKLADANDNLRAFNAKIGAEIPPEPDPSKFSGPLGRFFAYLQDGQAQMESAQRQLQSLKDKGQNLNAGDFLMIQVKMNKAEQLLNFSSVLLSNAVSGFKQMMQIQL